MANANHPKHHDYSGKGGDGPDPTASGTTSKGMAEKPAGTASGNPEAPEDLPAEMPNRRPNGKDATETGRLDD